MTKFIEVTDHKSNEKILINTTFLLEAKNHQVIVSNGYYHTKFKIVETYDDLKKMLEVK